MAWNSSTLSRSLSVALSGVLAFGVVGVVGPVSQAEAASSTAPPLVENTGLSAAPLPTAQINGIAWDQVIVGNTVYVAGEFTSARPAGAAAGTSESLRSNLMSYDLTSGVMTSWAPVVNGKVREITASPDGSRIYIGGSFTSVNGQPRYRVAAFNTSNGTLVSNFAPVVGSDVFGIAAGTDAVYLGGWFSSINGVARERLGAVSAQTGATTAWAPTANNTVNTLGLTAAEDRVIIGGSFAAVNGVATNSMASLDAVTGDLYPFAVNKVINNSAMNPQPGQGAAVTSISIHDDKMYATGWSFYMGNFEGAVKVDAYTGVIENLMECRGDTYDATPFRGVIYTVSHHHKCDGVGAFPEQSPRIFQHSDAVTDEATGIVQNAFTGQPAGSYVQWFPTWLPGPANAGSRSQQAGWSTEASGDYLAIGGEFLAVNGIAQQGLVRFATKPVSSAKTGPAAPHSEMAPTLRNLSETSVRISYKAQWDRDNRQLTSRIFRKQGNGTPVLIHETTSESNFWTRPTLNFVDTTVVPGQTYEYRIQWHDLDSPTRSSDFVSIVAGEGVPASDAYSSQVSADGAVNYWRLNESPGSSTVIDWGLEGNDLRLTSGVTLGAAGAVQGSTDTAATFSGSNGVTARTTTAQSGPNVFSAELWFKTTTNRGGKLIGFGNQPTGNSTSYDRHVYLNNAGRVTFGVYPGSSRTVTSARAYNDGAWHHVVASLSEAGMQLWIDGMKVGEEPAVTYGQEYTGYWRVGGDTIGSWPNAGSSAYFNGVIDEVAVYPAALTRTQIRDHYVKSGRQLNLPEPPSDRYGQAVVNDDPALYWRLGESTGSVAVDASANGLNGGYRNGTVQGIESEVAPDDTAARFDGTDDLVVSDHTETNPRTFSLETWFRTTSTAGGKIIGFGNANTGLSGSYDRHLYLDAQGRLNYGVYNGTTVVLTTPTSYNDGAWHHAVGTLGPDGMQLFVDGVSIGSDPNTVAEATTGYWRVGGDRSWSGASYFNGDIDEVAIYRKVLTADQVSAHYRASGVVTNLPPQASIGVECVALDCQFTANSSDPDGTVVSHNWSFGDGAESTETDPSHSYAAAGTHTATLLVTDDAGATFESTVEVVVEAPNAAPVARIGEVVIDGLEVAVDGSGSTDDGTIATYQWDFGDGTTGTGPTAEHLYTAAGAYTISLVVTDDRGVTGSASRSVSVTDLPGQAIASDSFSRVGGGWGTAETGGAWSDSGAAFFTTNGSHGQVTISRAGSGPVASLNEVSARDVTIVTDLALAARPTGGVYLHQLKARVNGSSFYKLTVRVETNGNLGLVLIRSLNGAEATLRSVTLSGFDYQPGERLKVRFDVSGSGTTALAAKVWRASTAEPGTTPATATDASAALQGAGSLGLQFYTSAGTTTLPTRVSVDNYLVVPTVTGTLENQPPTAAFSVTQADLAVTVDGSASTDDDGIAGYAWNFGDGQSGQGRVAQHTYSAAGSYQITLTVTDTRGLTAVTVQQVVVVPNAAPTAAFNGTIDGLWLSVDGRSSTDSDGDIVGYAWDFGDGGTATGSTAIHSYVGPGMYTVTLTVTDDEGGTNSSTRVFQATAQESPVIAEDEFNRTATGSWGVANRGGPWTVNAPAMFSVTGGRGVITIPGGGRGPMALLAATTAQEVSIVTDFALDKAPVNGSYFHQVLARVNGSNTYYMLSARLDSSRTLMLTVSRVVGGVETGLRTVSYGGFDYNADEQLQLRFDVSGMGGMTTLEGRVWRANLPEPAQPAITVVDATPVLQSAGGIGLRGYTSGSLTSVPLAVSIDRFSAES